MRYIVIGGSGFVGRYVIEALLTYTSNMNSPRILCLDIIPPKDKKENVDFICFDITKDNFTFKPDDIVIHLAARAYAPKPPANTKLSSQNLKKYFLEVNFAGTKCLIDSMLHQQCKNLIYFSTDMVYGKPKYLPIDSTHTRNPFGFYGLSKLESENYILKAREKGLNASIFRPRIIVGAGRYGILLKLFRLMDLNLPIPMIGNGKNCYQMISVKDCASAVICAIKKNIPNDEFNLGSLNPPTIKDLLSFLIKQANSKSLLLPTWGFGIKKILFCFEKIGFPLMYKEQYMIADEQYIVDISRTCEILEWQPKFNDKDMLLEAYLEYKNKRYNTQS